MFYLVYISALCRGVTDPTAQSGPPGQLRLTPRSFRCDCCASPPCPLYPDRPEKGKPCNLNTVRRDRFRCTLRCQSRFAKRSLKSESRQNSRKQGKLVRTPRRYSSSPTSIGSMLFISWEANDTRSSDLT